MSNLLIAAIELLLAVFLIAYTFRRRISAAPKILLLHSFESKSLDIGSFTLRAFERLLQSIEAAGLTIGDIEESLHDRTKVAITFDDGYDDLMQLEPLLRKLRIPITIFIPTAFIGKTNTWDNFLSAGKRRHLSESQIRQLSALGVRFGSHGHTHRDLTTLSHIALTDELTLSQRILSELTGHPIVDIAYPFGRANQRVIHAARKLGFTRQFASVPMNENSNLIGRIPIAKLDNSISINSKLSGNVLAGVEVTKSLIISEFSHLTPVVTRRQSMA